MKKEYMLPYNSVIQVCPDCGKVDVCLNDGHECFRNIDEEEWEAEQYNK